MLGRVVRSGSSTTVDGCRGGTESEVYYGVTYNALGRLSVCDFICLLREFPLTHPKLSSR